MKMGKYKLRMMMLTMVVLLVSACGNQVNHDGSAEQMEGDSSPESVSYETLYESTVFLGDSITEGLIFHDVLDIRHVVAGAGKTAQFALEDVEEVVNRQPEQLYIMLGSTDILWPTDDPLAYSMEQYATLIETIQSKLPETNMTLLSVPPVTEEVVNNDPRYGTIPEYNERLKALAAEKQVEYMDLSPLVAEHQELYDADGIHFQAEFYPLLLGYLK